MRALGLFLFCGGIVVSCGGAGDNTLLGDSGSDATGNDATSDGGSNCDPSRCAVPDGFHPIEWLANQTVNCADGWQSTDVVTTPVVADGACSCDCNITAQPTCNTGSVSRYSDADPNNATCNQPGYTVTANNGGCSAIGNLLFLSQAHYQVNAPPAVGGTCQFDAKLDPQKVSTSPGRVCEPPKSCLGAICDQNFCIAQVGDVKCPDSYPAKTLIGTAASAECAACAPGCAVNGKCGGTLSFFTDDACTLNKVDFAADGVCKANVISTSAGFVAYSYVGQLQSSSCGNAPTSTGTPKLDNPISVCCPASK